MIKISDLKQEDIGKWVEYTPFVGKKEEGLIKSWNEFNIFVVYNCNNEWDRYQEYTGVATNGKDLNFIEKHD